MYDAADCIDTASLSRRVPLRRLVQRGQVLDAGDHAGEQAELVRADLQSRRAGGVRVQRHRAERVDDRRVAEHQRADRRAAPGHRVDRDHIGVDLVDVDQPVRRGGGMVDDHQPADLVHQLGHRPQIGDGAQRRRRRRDGDQPGRAG